jgi:hypothetical protein
MTATDIRMSCEYIQYHGACQETDPNFANYAFCV